MPFTSAHDIGLAIDKPLIEKENDLNCVPLSPHLAIIIPTYNERGNIAELTKRIIAVMADVPFEIIIVDDNSPDCTWHYARELSQGDGRIRCIRRIGRQGLSGACLEGMLATHAQYIAVMDADLQHDESILPHMLATLIDGKDIVVGSRFIEGGSDEDGFNHTRQLISKLGRYVLGLVLKTDVKDTMSGFFMLNRQIIDLYAPQLSATGFKILADLLYCGGASLKTAEIGYHFRQRGEGVSKFNLRIGLEFIGLILNKITNGVIPIDLVSFLIVGTIGLIVHLSILYALIMMATDFTYAQSVAALCAMISNFTLNNDITWRHKRLSGWRWWRGLVIFCTICSASILANVSLAALIFERKGQWLVASLAGIGLGIVWNYVVSAKIVWQIK
jgi:dolichol-phosphate mannosyltransferase